MNCNPIFFFSTFKPFFFFSLIFFLPLSHIFSPSLSFFLIFFLSSWQFLSLSHDFFPLTSSPPVTLNRRLLFWSVLALSFLLSHHLIILVIPWSLISFGSLPLTPPFRFLSFSLSPRECFSLTLSSVTFFSPLDEEERTVSSSKSRV